MGFYIAMEKHSWSHVGFIVFSILFIGIARAANVFSCASLVNMIRPAGRKIPMQHQKAFWFSGLRGAMAFALALQSLHDLPEGHSQTIFTATTAIIVLTVLLIGGSTGPMLEALQVVGDDHDGPLGERFEEDEEYISRSYDEEGSTSNRLKLRLKEFRTHSFTSLDKNYLTSFTTQNEDDSGTVKSPLELSEEEWNNVMSTNLTGTWLVSKYVCKLMVDANQKGSIVNISSITGLDRGQMLVMALELSPYNISVNSISPGIFKSEITDKLMVKKWISNVVKKTIPLKTLGTSDPALTYSC